MPHFLGGDGFFFFLISILIIHVGFANKIFGGLSEFLEKRRFIYIEISNSIKDTDRFYYKVNSEIFERDRFLQKKNLRFILMG